MVQNIICPQGTILQSISREPLDFRSTPCTPYSRYKFGYNVKTFETYKRNVTEHNNSKDALYCMFEILGENSDLEVEDFYHTANLSLKRAGQ